MSLIEIQRSMTYNAIIFGSVGAALVAAGYFVYRRSKAKRQNRRASMGAKAFLILFAVIGFFLILGALLSLRF